MRKQKTIGIFLSLNSFRLLDKLVVWKWCVFFSVQYILHRNSCKQSVLTLIRRREGGVSAGFVLIIYVPKMFFSVLKSLTMFATFQTQDAFFLRIEANPCNLPTYDDNDDGVIALEEMRIVFPDMSLADKLFSDLDVNGMNFSPICRLTVPFHLKVHETGDSQTCL